MHPDYLALLFDIHWGEWPFFPPTLQSQQRATYFTCKTLFHNQPVRIILVPIPATNIYTISQNNNRETMQCMLIYSTVSKHIHQLQAADGLIQFAALVVYIVYDFLFFYSLSPDWLRHCGGQRDHGNPGSGWQPGGHEEQTGPHGRGDEPLRTTRHRRGPGVYYSVVSLFAGCGNFKLFHFTLAKFHRGFSNPGTGHKESSDPIYSFKKKQVMKSNKWRNHKWESIFTNRYMSWFKAIAPLDDI